MSSAAQSLDGGPSSGEPAFFPVAANTADGISLSIRNPALPSKPPSIPFDQASVGPAAVTQCPRHQDHTAGDGNSRPGNSRQGRVTQSKSRLGPEWFAPSACRRTGDRDHAVTPRYRGPLMPTAFRNSPPRRAEMSTPRAAAAVSRAIRI